MYLVNVFLYSFLKWSYLPFRKWVLWISSYRFGTYDCMAW